MIKKYGNSSGSPCLVKTTRTLRHSSCPPEHVFVSCLNLLLMFACFVQFYTARVFPYQKSIVKQRWSLSVRHIYALLRRIMGTVCQSLCILQCGHLVSTFRNLQICFLLSLLRFPTFSIVSANSYVSFNFYSGISFLRLFPFFLSLLSYHQLRCPAT